MTAQQDHERNIAWIDERIAKVGRMFPVSAVMATNSLRANRKVLERHGPRVTGFRYSDNDPIGYECAACRIVFPCPTTTDITEGLGIKSE